MQVETDGRGYLDMVRPGGGVEMGPGVKPRACMVGRGPTSRREYNVASSMAYPWAVHHSVGLSGGHQLDGRAEQQQSIGDNTVTPKRGRGDGI